MSFFFKCGRFYDTEYRSTVLLYNSKMAAEKERKKLLKNDA